MTAPGAEAGGAAPRIPIRNLWFLLLHAWDLARLGDRYGAEVEALDDDAPLAALIACLLCAAVDGRLRRGLRRGYVARAAVTSRVRGRIDALRTEARHLAGSGRVACRFEEMTADTPRNRYVRAALAHLAASVLPPPLHARCRALAHGLAAAGVGLDQGSPRAPDPARAGRGDAEDQLMLEAARLAFDLALPTEAAGPRAVAAAERAEAWLRRLFERAVCGFYRASLPPSEGWAVLPGRRLDWERTDGTAGIPALLPGMIADITIDRGEQRLVVDTKFTGATRPDRWGREAFQSAHVYQLYAYLQSQAGRDSPRDDHASGLLLYPTVDAEMEEEVTIQCHRIRFATVDLNGQPAEIAARLLHLAGFDGPRPRHEAGRKPSPAAP